MVVTTLEAGYDVPNAGGIRRLILVEAGPALTILDPERYPLQGIEYPGIGASNVLIAEDAPMAEWLLLPGLGEFVFSDQYTTSNGHRTDCTISWDVPAASVPILQWLAKHGARRWVALVQDANDQGYVVGDPANGMRLISGHASNRKRPDGSKRTFSMSCSMAHPVWLLDDFALLTTYRPEFDLSFDSSFTS